MDYWAGGGGRAKGMLAPSQINWGGGGVRCPPVLTSMVSLKGS